jgi:hypothetical protein
MGIRFQYGQRKKDYVFVVLDYQVKGSTV